MLKVAVKERTVPGSAGGSPASLTHSCDCKCEDPTGFPPPMFAIGSQAGGPPALPGLSITFHDYPQNKFRSSIFRLLTPHEASEA
ncbi:MAG: hypothetical protein AB1631_18485 [Acidobacteriota bacterium]